MTTQTPSTTETTPVTEPVSDPSTSAIEASDYATAVWPLITMSVRDETPEAAVQSFATGFAGFTDPIIGEFMQGDSRSGEFEVRATADGPLTLYSPDSLDPTTRGGSSDQSRRTSAWLSLRHSNRLLARRMEA